ETERLRTRCLAAATARGLVRRERANLAPRPRPPGLIAPSEVKDEIKNGSLAEVAMSVHELSARAVVSAHTRQFVAGAPRWVVRALITMVETGLRPASSSPMTAAARRSPSSSWRAAA